MENNSYLNCKKVDTAISRAKEILIDRVKTDGLYECFGQKEVRAIRDKFVDLCDYSKEMNTIRSKIDNFDEWYEFGVKEYNIVHKMPKYYS